MHSCDEMKEIWELVYPDGTPSGVLYDRESGDPIPTGLCFKVCEVFVRAGDRLLLTQRHPDKWQGLKWEASGGGVLMGESDVNAAARELREETGIAVSSDRLKYLGRTLHGVAMVESFLLLLTSDPLLTLDPAEVVGAKYVLPSEIDGIARELTGGTLERLRLYFSEIFADKNEN